MMRVKHNAIRLQVEYLASNKKRCTTKIIEGELHEMNTAAQ